MNKNISSISLLVCVLSLILGFAKGDSWTSSVNLLQPRTGAALAQLSQTTFAVIGGLDDVNSTNPLTSVEVFSTNTQSWSNTTIPPLPIALAHASAAFDSARNAIWVVGGYTLNFEIVPYLFKYNFTSSGWMQLASLPSARAGHIAFLISGNLYVFGGLSNSSYESQTFVYSPVGDIWEHRNSLLYPRAFLTGVVGSGNLVYLLGGRNPDHLKVMERYSVQGDTFEQISSMPSRRSGASAALLDNKIYVFGGLSDIIQNSTEEYDISSDLWFCRTGMNISRENSNAVVAGGTIYVVGGETPAGVTGAMETYTVPDIGEPGFCPVEGSAVEITPVVTYIVTLAMLLVTLR